MLFTGEGIAKALHLDLSTSEMSAYLDREEKENKFWKKIFKRSSEKLKLFLVFFATEDGRRAFIIPAKNDYNARIGIVPHIHYREDHHHIHPVYDKSCAECMAIFQQFADWLNEATVIMLGLPSEKMEANIIQVC